MFDRVGELRHGILNVVDARAGFNGWIEIPESPPFARMTIARSKIAPTPTAARINCVRVDTRMSRNASKASSPARTKNHGYHDQFRLV